MNVLRRMSLHRRRHRSSRNRAAVILASIGAAATRAAEAPNYVVSTLSTQTIYTATAATSSVPGFKPHVNFPDLKIRADGTLEVDFEVGQTHGSGVFGLRGYRSDGGVTWNGFTSTPPSTPNSSLVRPAGQISYGVSYATSSGTGTTSWANTLYTSTNGGTNWAYSNAYFDSGGVSYTSVYNNLTDMTQDGTLLLTTGYGQRTGASTQETMLFASADNGVHWTRRSTIAGYTADPSVGMASEGPSESSLVQLNNGSLLSVFRTGQPFPGYDVNATQPTLMWAMSGDNGSTWTTPKMLGVGGAFPLLHKLDDGGVALTYGRYGAKVMLVDPTGLRWTTPTVIYNGPGSGYVDMKELPNGNFCFVYDQSSFYPPSWNGSVPSQYVYNNDQSGNLKSAILSIQQQGSTDDYHWASEYHGDVSPDTLATPWSKAQSGTTNQYLWADQGQDYLRIDTTATSNAATLNYSLPASNTPWQGISFSKGAVIDLRARAGSSGTTQGSADVLMGDGVNGYAILQLTGSSVILQGAGGTGSQASYTSAAHSGYLSTDWHNYRVIISPDPTNSGIVTAKVYLDGNYTTPILTKLLTASGLDLLRVGDESGSANGIFDVDYLRFSDRWGQWNVDGDGSFSSLANWSATTPTGVDATANLMSAITSPRTITIDAPTTLGHINFNNANRYTLAGGTITMQVSGGSADITLTSGNHTIGGPLNLVSNTNISGNGILTTGTITNSAALAIQTDTIAGAIDGTGSISVGVGHALTADHVRQSALAVTGLLVINPGRSSMKASNIGSLTIASGAAVDLGDNDLTLGASSAASIRGWLVSGFAGGAWTGPGIRSSVAALIAADSSNMHKTALGYFDTGTPLVRYTYSGDANLDGTVNALDFNALASNFGTNSPQWTSGDFNYDGVVNTLDFNALASNFGMTLPQSASLGGVVPEPAVFGALLGLVICRRRTR
jgi:hypothetical protein